LNQEKQIPSIISGRKILVLGGVLALSSMSTFADEGGTSFWLPGQYSSFAAVQSDPGWSMPLIYFHASREADRNKEFPDDGRITVGLKVEEDLLLAVPTYTFENPVLGGQAALSVAGIYGRGEASVSATLTEPGGDVLSGSESDTLTSVGDLYPSYALRWNNGVHNSVVYGMLGVPVGSYEVNRLVNIGTNHWSVDIGGGYTYLNMDTGREFSAVAGLTYNFENPDTEYQNGMDFHLDMGVSQFISDQWHIGLVGYVYQQVTGDSGTGAKLGDFESSVLGIGPQVGYFFPMGEQQAYLNLKGYWDFDAERRPEGWNSWLTLSLPL
jgi:hypothetical protein